MCDAPVATEILFNLYWRTKPENMPIVMKSIVKNIQPYIFLSYISSLLQQPITDVTKVSSYFDFLSQYVIIIQQKINPEIAHFVFEVFIKLAKQNFEPASYDTYSKFLTILIPSIKTIGQLSIEESINELSPQMALFPQAHYAMAFPESFNTFIEKLSMMQNTASSISQCSILNETLAAILRNGYVDTLDKIKFFTFTDLGLDNSGTIDSKFDLLMAAFDFFDKKEMTQLMRIHFYSLITKLPQTQNIKNSTLAKLFSISVFELNTQSTATAVTQETQAELILKCIRTVFDNALPHFKENKQVMDSLERFCGCIDAEVLKDEILRLSNKPETFHAVLFIISKFPSEKVFPLFVRVAPPAARAFQYSQLMTLASSGKLMPNFLIYLFGILKPTDIPIIKKAAHDDPKVYTRTALQFLLTSSDLDRIKVIVKEIESFQKVPAVDFRPSDCAEIAVLLTALYFTKHISNTSVIEYLEFLHNNNKSKDEFEFGKKENMKDFPTAVKFFFDNKNEFKQVVFETALSRIRKGDALACITAAALSKDATTLTHSITLMNKEQRLVTALLCAAVSACEAPALLFLSTMHRKKTGFIIFSTVSDPELVKCVFHAWISVAPIVTSSEESLSVITALLNEQLQTSELNSLCQSIIKFLANQKKLLNLEGVIERMLDNAIRIREEIFDDLFTSIIRKNKKLKSNLAQRICQKWIAFLKRCSIKEKSDFEEALLRKDYATATFPHLMSLLHNEFITGGHSENIFFCVQRAIKGYENKNSVFREIPVFAAFSMDRRESVSKVCVECLRHLTGIQSTTKPNLPIGSEYIDANSAFFTELASTLSKELIAVLSALDLYKNDDIKEKHGLSLFMMAMIQKYPKEVFALKTNFVAGYLEVPHNHDFVTFECFTRAVTLVRDSLPTLLFNHTLQSMGRIPHEVVKIVISGSSFKHVFGDAINSVINGKPSSISVANLCNIFSKAVRKGVIVENAESLLNIVTVTSWCLINAHNIDKEHRESASSSMSRVITTLFLVKDEVVKKGLNKFAPKTSLVNFTNIVYLSLLQLPEDEIKNFVSRLEVLEKGNLTALPPLIMAYLVHQSPIPQSKTFNTLIQSKLFKYIPKAKEWTSTVLLLASSGIAKELLVGGSEVKPAFEELSQCFIHVRDPQNIQELLPAMVSIIKSLDDLFFGNMAKRVAEIIQHAAKTTPQLLFMPEVEELIQRLMKALSGELNFPGAAEIFVVAAPALFDDRESAMALLKSLFGDIPLDQMFQAASKSFKWHYADAAAAASTFLQKNLDLVNDEALELLARIFRILKQSQTDKASALGAFRKLLVTFSEKEWNQTALRMIIEFA